MAHETDWFAPLRTAEARHQRCFWRRVGAGLAILVVIAVIALLTGCAGPEIKHESPYDGPPMIAQGPTGDRVRLTKEPCKQTLGWLKFAAGEMLYQGKVYKACWVKVGQTVLIFDDNGDVTPVPAAMFRPEVDA